MSSFKVDKSGNTKRDIRNGGVFLALIGLVVVPVFSMVAGGIMIVAGVVLALAGTFASE